MLNRHVRTEKDFDFPELLAAEVRGRRASLRLTQRDLAQLSGVSERFVRFVEQGKPSVQLDSLLALLDTLGLELQIATQRRGGIQQESRR